MLSVYIQAVLFTVMAVFSSPKVDSYIRPETSLETAILDRAYQKCPLIADPGRRVLLSVLRTEERYKVPSEMRGMTLAAACRESQFDPNAEGDHKFSKNGTPKAIGMFQLWPWYERVYNIDRRDPVDSADAWLHHIAKMIPRVKRQCKLTDPEEIWATAWITGVLAPKEGGRCGEIIDHYRTLQRWREAWFLLDRNGELLTRQIRRWDRRLIHAVVTVAVSPLQREDRP